MTNQNEWEIKSRSDVCSQTQESFQDGQLIYTRLIFKEGEGYVREDYSESAWLERGDKSGLSVWKGVFRAPPPPPEEAVKKKTAESLLRKFMESEDPTNRNAIYILAVMLERKRLLVEQDVQQREGGVRIRIYEHKQTGETFVIPDPELKLSKLEEVQEEVVVLLGGKPPRRPEEEEPDADDDDEEDDDEDEYDD